MTLKKHNPKSSMPAVYIPCWLIQVPNKLLSFAAKVLYGRLAQWSNENGDVYRSYNQLAKEIGSSKRSVNEYLRELREVKLIDTLHPQAGGLNHFVFYDHPWMYEQINEFLCYKSQPDPEQNPALPRAESCFTPEQNPAPINNKEIKKIKEKEIYKEKENIEEGNLVSKNNSLNPNYEYPDTYFAKESSQKKINITEYLKQNNPLNIAEDALDDFVEMRRQIKAPLSVTAWNGLLKQLQKCVNKGLSPHDVFESMVVNAWRSIRADWFINQPKSKPRSRVSEDWDKNMHLDMF